MLMAIDNDGSHGTNGTPQNFGSLARGTKSRSPKVDKSQIGRVIAYPIQPSVDEAQ